jgi:N6-L-threonylcarbamoyladenine synthase
MKPPLILAIDTSCDDTSAAVVQGFTVLSNIVASQVELHKQYGGIFPTIAKQAHRERIKPTVELALKRAKVQREELTAIAVTQGPGLAPALEVGIDFAKQLAAELKLPLIPVNHIEGHALSVLAEPKKQVQSSNLGSNPTVLTQFPVLSLIISGGHTEFVLVHDFGKYERIGWTVDDAAGEALDKFGRMVDLGYPAGPVVEQFALEGNPNKFKFPLPMTTSGNYNMSFSGLKTSVRKKVEEMSAAAPLNKQDIYDLCASFQYAVFHAITYKLNKFLQKYYVDHGDNALFGVWLGGGVAANITLRAMLRKTLKTYNLELKIPYSKRLCSDNAAMIGVVGHTLFTTRKSGYAHFNFERSPNLRIGTTPIT